MSAPIGKGNNTGSQERVIPAGRISGDHIVTQEGRQSRNIVPNQKLYNPEAPLNVKATAGFKGTTATKVSQAALRKL